MLIADIPESYKIAYYFTTAGKCFRGLYRMALVKGDLHYFRFAGRMV